MTVEDWQIVVIWATGALLGTFLSYLWLEDREVAGQASAAALLWPASLLVLAALSAFALAVAPFYLVYHAALKTRAWALEERRR